MEINSAHRLGDLYLLDTFLARKYRHFIISFYENFGFSLFVIIYHLLGVAFFGFDVGKIFLVIT